jgi:hypothetical protein
MGVSVCRHLKPMAHFLLRSFCELNRRETSLLDSLIEARSLRGGL